MTPRMLTIAAVAAALAVSGGVLAKVAKVGEPVPAVPPTDASAIAPVYQRILTDDPAARAEIVQLYAEDRAMQDETMQKLTELQDRIAAESDWDARRALYAEGRTLKESLETRHIEIGLRIAELNGDTQRAEDFGRALDQIRNADARRRATFADPSIEAERKRQMGQ